MIDGMYWLDETGKPLPVPENAGSIELGNYFQWLENNRKLRQEYIDDFFVSTVFLGMDHSFCNDTPVLWETMIFLKPDIENGSFGPEKYCRRYMSQVDAINGHEKICKLVSSPLTRDKLFDGEYG